jgi:cytochrome c oxidase assembly protein subunit 15
MRLTTSPAVVRSRDLLQRGLAGVFAHVQERHVRRLAVATTVLMFLVYAMGTLVTTTQSGHGCGASWPLCDGKLVPPPNFSTVIEFSHRIVTFFVTFFVLGTAIGVLWYWRSRLELRILAPVMVLALFAEAGLGAALVLLPASGLLLAIHFGASLLLVSSVFLTAVIVNELGGWDALRDRALPGAGYRWLVYGLLAFTYVVGYLGAFTRATHQAPGCGDWPLCAGSAFPGFGVGYALAFAHRLAAFALMLGTLGLFLWSRRARTARPDLYRGSVWALILVLAQALIGALVATSGVAAYSQMLHAGCVALLFASLCYLGLHTLPRPASARRVAPKNAPGAQRTSRPNAQKSRAGSLARGGR